MSKIVQDFRQSSCDPLPLLTAGMFVMSDSLARTAFVRGTMACLPLTLACAPWGLLAGSTAIDAQLTPAQSQGLSLFVFAGAAQLVAIGMIKGGASVISILVTTLLLTSQHLLYAMHLRPLVAPLEPRWRLGLGFLLTDEFFALVSPFDQKTFDRWYALGVGLCMYVGWNIFTLLGVLLARVSRAGSTGAGVLDCRDVHCVNHTHRSQLSDNRLHSSVVADRGAVQLLGLGVGHCAGRAVGHGCRLSVQATGRVLGMIWAIIGGMTLILFFNRYLFLEPRLPIRLNRGVKEFLGFAVRGC